MWSPLTKRTVFWLAIALLVMGFEMPRCAGSRIPLTEPEDGFVDPSLLGGWGTPRGFYIEDVSIVYHDIGFDVTLDEAGSLRVISHYHYDCEGANLEFIGHSSVVDGRRYLNLKLADCPVCDSETPDPESAVFCEQLLADQDTSACPYLILQYRTGAPANISDQFFDDFEDKKQIASYFEKYEGRYVSIGGMDSDFVLEAISGGLIDGEPECDECNLRVSCITADRSAIKEFVRKYDAQLYPEENWTVYIEVEDAD